MFLLSSECLATVFIPEWLTVWEMPLYGCWRGPTVSRLVRTIRKSPINRVEARWSEHDEAWKWCVRETWGYLSCWVLRLYHFTTIPWSNVHRGHENEWDTNGYKQLFTTCKVIKHSECCTCWILLGWINPMHHRGTYGWMLSKGAVMDSILNTLLSMGKVLILCKTVVSFV